MPNEHDSATLALRSAILDSVRDSQGVKATELAANVIVAIGGSSVDEDFVETLDRLIEEGEVIEIEYTLPEMPYRVKSFLLPKGCKLRSLRNGKSSFMFTPEGLPSGAADRAKVAEAAIAQKDEALVVLHADLTEAQFQTDNWRKVAEARAIENDRLRRIIMASDDGVTPE